MVCRCSRPAESPDPLPMIYLGIDPGKKGGYATISIVAGKAPLALVSPWDDSLFTEVVNWLSECDGCVFCAVEKVHSMPQQGVKSTFNFGQSYGFIKGVLTALGTPFQEIPPQEWKKEFGLIGKDKKESIRVCKQLFPRVSLLPTEKSRVDSDGMAEALLIAEYARRKYNDT